MKVLLRERKRHTGCQVANTRCAALSPGGGTPIQPNREGCTPVRLDGVPHHPLNERVTPPPIWAGWEYPLPLWTDTQSENTTILRMRQ